MSAGTEFRPVLTGKTLWVSPNAVTDGISGRLDYPFLTPTLAQAAAVSGDIIIVLPGAYTTTASLAKDGVNWHFMPGATVTKADTSTVGIWDDAGSAMSYKVTGLGDFLRTSTTTLTMCVNVGNASSSVYIEAGTISCVITGATKKALTVKQTAGAMTIRARTITGTSGAAATGDVIWWENGTCEIDCNLISGVKSRCVYSLVSAVPTGDMFVTAFNITTTATSAIYSDGTDATAAMWIRSDTVRSAGNSVAIYGAGRLYVEAQKLFGSIYAAGIAGSTGLVYVRSDKISAVSNGDIAGEASLLHWHTNSTATLRAEINHWDANGFTGDMIAVNAGTVTIQGMDLPSAASVKGVTLTAGTLRINDLRIDTSANNAANPITKSGGVLVLKNVTLVAEATRDSIEAGSAQNVVAMASWANTAVDANVTITTGATGLTVDSDVT